MVSSPDENNNIKKVYSKADRIYGELRKRYEPDFNKTDHMAYHKKDRVYEMDYNKIDRIYGDSRNLYEMDIVRHSRRITVPVWNGL